MGDPVFVTIKTSVGDRQVLAEAVHGVWAVHESWTDERAMKEMKTAIVALLDASRPLEAQRG